MADRLYDGCDAGQDEVDAGQELLTVVVPAQLRCYLTHERVLRGGSSCAHRAATVARKADRSV